MNRTKSTLLTVGVDLGGTKVYTGLADSTGHIIAAKKALINPEKNVEKIIDDVLRSIEECLHDVDREAQALGVGAAGQVDADGVIRDSPNLKWQNVPLKKMLEEALELPVVVINDVRAATWGEWRYGAGKGVSDLVVLFVGTGIGGGVISGGNLLAGCSNVGGELGHTTIVVGGRQCHCPNRGCLEAYAGGWAIAERVQEDVRTDPPEGRYVVSIAGTVENITAATVSQAAREGDPYAQRVVKETGRYLAAGVVSIVNAFNPCLLVLGGGVIEGIPELIPIVEDIVRNHALPAAVENLKVVKTVLGDQAGVIGAATYAQNRIIRAVR